MREEPQSHYGEGISTDTHGSLAHFNMYVCVCVCVLVGGEQRAGFGQEDCAGEADEWCVWPSTGELHL